MRKAFKVFRTFVAALIIFCIAAPTGITAFAVDELPSSFWPINNAYVSAKERGDDDGIIRYGEQSIELLTRYTETNQIREILASRYYDVADAYDRRNDFVTAAYYYEKYIPYGEYMGWTDGVIIARSKISQYTLVVKNYTETNVPQVYYGAKNEPEMGVLYGEVVEHTRENESMVLVYVNYGDDLPTWVGAILDTARQRGIAVEIALNILDEGLAVGDIPNHGEYIENLTAQLNEYSDVPIYLRIGAEMNIWDDLADPNEYIEAFRFISSYVKANTQHVAVVWSVSHASSWNIDMEDYYPGDEYVDWVGISAYLIRHFQGQEQPIEQRFNDTFFCSGDGADPVMVVKETIEKFGERKPIMLSECGSAHRTISSSLDTDNTEWAERNLRRMYTYVPMVYPQVKLMAYFNMYYPGETNVYTLHDNPVMENSFLELTQQRHFIQNRCGSRSEITYKEITDGMTVAQTMLPIYTYPHIFGDDEPEVYYYLDGEFAGSSATLPYLQYLDLSQVSLGAHSLETRVVSNGAQVASQTITVNVVEDVTVIVDGSEIETDSVPLLINDRTMVPLRSIFEALGAEITWDDATRTVTANKDGVTISLTIDSPVMYKNEAGAQEDIALDSPAIIVNERTMVPARAVSEALGASVEWDEADQIVTITSSA